MGKDREVDRLTNELTYEEQKLNHELNSKQSEKDYTLHDQQKKRKELDELHARRLLEMKKEHERKKFSDEEKFEALLEQKELAAEEFSKTIRNLKIEQENLLERMAHEHNDAL